MLRALIVTALAVAGLAATAPQGRQRIVIGYSVRGHPIVAYERGDRSAPATLVIGVIHGTEPAGLGVISQLRRLPLPARVHLWLVPTVNPDGLAAGTRQNAHGVDLNRNFPSNWSKIGAPLSSIGISRPSLAMSTASGRSTSSRCSVPYRSATRRAPASSSFVTARATVAASCRSTGR